MKPIHLSSITPASVDPGELVNRDLDAQWLREGLLAWFRSSGLSAGGAFCVLGDKGIGKSILTRRVIDDLRNLHTATTAFLTVDCRPLRGQRDVYREAATQLVEQLGLHRDVPAALLAEAQSFDALTRFDEVTLRHAHEHLIQFKASFDLGGASSFVKWLDSKLGISLVRDKKTIEKLEGSLTVDGARLQEGFVQLLHDISEHSSLRVVLYLDNIEELNHEALRKADRREVVRAEVEALLHLSEAPLGLVLNMRTYYSSVLTRRISQRRILGPMSAAEQREIFARRLARADKHERTLIDGAPEVSRTIDTLAELAPTPLAFLTWVEFILTEGLYAEADMIAALGRRLTQHYSTIARRIPEVAALFDEPGALASAEAVLEACANSQSLYRELIDQQVVLPHNYWDPSEYYLDPELAFLIPRQESSSR